MNKCIYIEKIIPHFPVWSFLVRQVFFFFGFDKYLTVLNVYYYYFFFAQITRPFDRTGSIMIPRNTE